MKKPIIITFLLFWGLGYHLQAQGFLNKLKEKVKQKTENTIDDKVDETLDDAFNLGRKDGNNSSSNSGNNSSSSSSGSSVNNNRGGGLIVTPPDVATNISEASSSFNSERYSAARNAIKQAIIGVEMEIGNDVLANLPASVQGLNKVEEKDKVTSSGIGFVGLTIQRVYEGGDQELEVLVANNSALMAGINMYMSSTYTTSSTDQNWKHTTINGHKGIIEYDDYSGYKVSLPIGQSSVFVLEGKNFADEPAIMAAAEKFDIDYIKNQLGEK